MHNSAMINLHAADFAAHRKVKRIFYSSSACMYPAHNQEDPDNPKCAEETAYPAAPDSEYGWEKLFSERMYLSFGRNHGLNVRIARFHNIFGPEGTWQGGKEKAPAALMRKVAEQPDGGEIEMWGDGLQTRSFLYIDECIEAVRRLMEGSFQGPVNIGSEEMVTINQMAEMVMKIAGKRALHQAYSRDRPVCEAEIPITSCCERNSVGNQSSVSLRDCRGLIPGLTVKSAEPAKVPGRRLLEGDDPPKIKPPAH